MRQPKSLSRGWWKIPWEVAESKHDDDYFRKVFGRVEVQVFWDNNHEAWRILVLDYEIDFYYTRADSARDAADSFMKRLNDYLEGQL